MTASRGNAADSADDGMGLELSDGFPLDLDDDTDPLASRWTGRTCGY